MGAGASTWTSEQNAAFIETQPDEALRPLAKTVRAHDVDFAALANMDETRMAELCGEAAPKVAAVYMPRLDKERGQADLIVHEKGRVFFENLTGFVGAKKAIDETAQRVLPRNYMARHPSFKTTEKMVQMALDGAEDVSIDAVFGAAESARGPFERIMSFIVKRAGLVPDATVIFEGQPLCIDKKHAPGQHFTRVTIAPPKGRARASEKIENEYGGEARKLVDVVRCSVVVDREDELFAVAEALAGDGDISITPDGDAFEVVRLKNRFKEPLFNGYRDALYSVRVRLEGDVWHVCELQLHLSAVIAHKEHTHVYCELEGGGEAGEGAPPLARHVPSFSSRR